MINKNTSNEYPYKPLKPVSHVPSPLLIKNPNPALRGSARQLPSTLSKHSSRSMHAMPCQPSLRFIDISGIYKTTLQKIRNHT